MHLAYDIYTGKDMGTLVLLFYGYVLTDKH